MLAYYYQACGSAAAFPVNLNATECHSGRSRCAAAGLARASHLSDPPAAAVPLSGRRGTGSGCSLSHRGAHSVQASASALRQRLAPGALTRGLRPARSRRRQRHTAGRPGGIVQRAKSLEKAAASAPS